MPGFFDCAFIFLLLLRPGPTAFKSHTNFETTR
jgi:hypothetical protein